MVIDVKRTGTYSASITAVIWLIAVLAVLFIPLSPNKKTEYPVVKITLSSSSPTRNEPQTAAQVSESTAQTAPQSQTQPRPAEQTKSAVQSKPAEVPQTSPAQTQPRQQNTPPKAQVNPQQQVESPPQVLAPDLSTLSLSPAATQSQNAPKKPAEWPSDAEWVTQSTQPVKTSPDARAATSPASASPAVPQFEGTAAVAQNTDTGAKAASTGRTQSSANVSDSGQTAGALKRIAESTYSQSGGSPGLSYETAMQTVSQTSSGGVEIQMRDGSTRRLLDPKEPKIVLSPESEKLIDSSKRVMVQFRVLAAGTVPGSSVTFSPAGLLPLPVQEEVRAQISRWRFETAQSDGQAAFQYSIKKE